MSNAQYILVIIHTVCTLLYFVWSSDWFTHYNDVIMSAMAPQITSMTIVYSTVYSDADHRKHQSSASLAFGGGGGGGGVIHRRPVNSPHKRPVTRTIFPFEDVIMHIHIIQCCSLKPHQPYDCHSALEATLKNMGKRITWINNKLLINPLHAKFSERTKHILHFITFLCIDMTQIFEFFLYVRQKLTYST